MNDFELAYLNTIAREATQNLLENDLDPSHLTDEQRATLAAVLMSRILEDDDDRE